MSIAVNNGFSVIKKCTQRFLASYNMRPPIEPEPGLCCQEGCESCVWLVYAQELLDYYRQKYPTDTLNKVKEEIGDKIESPSVREYVMMELAMTEKRYRNMAAIGVKKKKPGEGK
ncbi:hypothetical protein GCK72_013657 [Caenorhabditis remanei]|uniref:Oxidoreductase-like domain-containing protein n=2 Tax=Caenorhabditis remanei TaxID=31234 RepID=E3MSB8_CAERE|nr:hypothetical protein GCK72_013657 [Caenorhabditis remanei]EFP08214.1 hypothetical protein CRE_16850 [Caenorhabditis remanei]KAF1757202.1 hypothetical protein GCK72_013657 [Caenorhabditis remanei]